MRPSYLGADAERWILAPSVGTMAPMRAVLVAAVSLAANASAAPPPPPVPVPAREARPPYEPAGAQARRAVSPSTPASRAPEPAGAQEAPPVETEEYTRSGFGFALEGSLGDCTGETCRNHESGLGFGLGAEATYRFEMGLALGLGYWAQGVAADPNSSYSAWDACQPLADGRRDEECASKWKESILRYRLWGILARWYFLSDGPLDPFVGLVAGSAWFQLWGRFEVERAGEIDLGQLSYALTGPAIALEAGTDLYATGNIAIGGLFRWTIPFWNDACLSGDLGTTTRERLGLPTTCTDPANLDGTGMTEAGSPSALQFMLRGRFTL